MGFQLMSKGHFLYTGKSIMNIDQDTKSMFGPRHAKWPTGIELILFSKALSKHEYFYSTLHEIHL